MYGLPDRPLRDAGNYISWRAMNVAIRPHLSNPEWESILGNKWIFSQFFNRLGARVPEAYGFLHSTAGRTAHGDPLHNDDDLLTWCKNSGIRAFVLKPVGGLMSRGIFIILDVNPADGVFTLADGRRLGVDELNSQIASVSSGGLEGYLVQELIRPHESLAELNAGSPTNIRVLTARLPDSNYIVQAATARIARSGSQSDAWNKGGIAASIDIESGQIVQALMHPDHGGETITQHPDSNVRLPGFVIPHWDEVKRTVLEAAAMTPGIDVIGWDVVIGDSGPWLIEGNSDWNLQLSQAPTDGFRLTTVAEVWRTLGGDIPDGSFSWRWRYRKRILPALVRRLDVLVGRKV